MSPVQRGRPSKPLPAPIHHWSHEGLFLFEAVPFSHSALALPCFCTASLDFIWDYHAIPTCRYYRQLLRYLKRKRRPPFNNVRYTIDCKRAYPSEFNSEDIFLPRYFLILKNFNRLHVTIARALILPWYNIHCDRKQQRWFPFLLQPRQ